MTMSERSNEHGKSGPALEKTVSADEAGVTADGAGSGSGRLSAGTKLGRYEIVEFIGGGGMGWVYRAKDTELEREVAIKVVQPTVAGPKGRERLLAEARAMAKLRHRAVVPVFDVGEYAGGVYVAMALVKGGTLHDWMHAEARPWRQVVARFLEAGRGLVAAHAAGIVHRDFKPRNVLLGEGGEVMVADFGIASASVDASDGEGVGGGAREATSIVGTPAYMAPEQAAGQAVDARADQYSFCVSLWEGLHGQRPQEAETRTQGALLERSHAAPKSRRRVPGWLTEAVARGFAPAPEKRWPTLAALLERLDGGLGRRRRRIIALSAVATVCIVAAVFAGMGSRRDPCSGADDEVGGAWNPTRRSVLSAVLRAAAPSFAEETLARLIPTLDERADGLRAGARATCQAARLRHSISERVMDARMACLDAAVADLRAVVDALLAGDLNVAARAVEMSYRLRDQQSCTALTAFVDAPLLSRDLQPRVDALGHRLEKARLLLARGRYRASLDEMRAIADEARAVGYSPLTVRTLRALLDALQAVDGNVVEVNRELVDAAAAAHDDESLAIAWANIIYATYVDSGESSVAAALLDVLRAAVERAGRPARLRYREALSRGYVALLAKRGDDARRAFVDAVGLADSPADKYLAQNNVMSASIEIGDSQRAKAEARHALDLAIAAYGESHPEVALARLRLAQRQLAVGEVVEGQQGLDLARVSLVDAMGERSAWLSEVYVASAAFAAAKGDHAEALRNRQIVVDIDERVGQNTRSSCLHLMLLASSLAEAGRFTDAEPMFLRALSGYEALLGRDSFEYARTEGHLGMYLASHKRCEDATKFLQHAQAVLADRAEAVLPLQWLSDCAYRAGRHEEAFAGAERVLATCARLGCAPGFEPALMANYGSWLIDHGPATKAHGVQLMRQAAEDFSKLGNEKMADRIKAFLSE